MSTQKKTILVLGIVALLIIVIFIMGLRCNSKDQAITAENFDPEEFPVFKAISDLLGEFAPKLEREELTGHFQPGTFRVQPSQEDKDLRNAEFCIDPVSPGDSNAMIVIEYQAAQAEERFADLRTQICTVSVRDTERFPSCCTMPILQSSGQVRFRAIRGRASIRLRENEIIRLE